MNPSTLSATYSEPLIGTAVPADTFILIETPQPWSKPALLSEGIPESLRQVVRPLLGPGSGVRVHLIANEKTPSRTQRRLLIFQRTMASSFRTSAPTLLSKPTGEYKAWEIQVDTPAAMAPALSQFWAEPSQVRLMDRRRIRSNHRHLMICTHASHNECCGIYGYPFYQQAIAHIQRLGLTQHIYPWQISHIGGHRFAPTLIDFPQGRYYGHLDEVSLQCLLKREGAIAPLLPTYRGWSLLPKPLQILEGELLRQYGWEWLRGRATGRILDQDKDHQQSRVELWFESAEHTFLHYIAEIQASKLQHYRLEPSFELDSNQLIHRKTG
ncbi:MAG: sucrase ferredoxin [Leptolyngbyaceae cyanobacterium]